jgi:cytochrome P450
MSATDTKPAPGAPGAPRVINPTLFAGELGVPGPPREVTIGDRTVWIFSRFEDVRACLAHPRLSLATRFAADHGLEPPAGGLFANTMLGSDPPDHTRLRKLVAGAFTMRRIEALRPKVKQITEDILDQLAPLGEADLVETLTYPVPMQVICELLGVPIADRDDFHEWTDIMFRPGEGPDGIARARDASAKLAGYITDLTEAKRREPSDDLLTALNEAYDGDDRLTFEEVVGTGRLLLHAGFDTTASFLGNSVYKLLVHPAEREAVREDPTLLRTAVDELLRLDGPSTVNMRFAKEDLEISGARIRKDQQIVLDLEGAHRDPVQFAAGAEIDLRRAPNPHLTFGHGIHHCLGSPLARLEGQVVLVALFNRFPDLRLAVPAEEIRRQRPNHPLRGPERLPVVFTPQS